MVSEPRDKGAYRLAVGAVGLALVVVLLGICLILAFGPSGCDSECPSKLAEIPSELWKIVSALGGGLLGLLAPSPTKAAKGEDGEEKKKEKKTSTEKWNALKQAAGTNLTVAALLFVFVVSVIGGIAVGSTGLESLAAASGAALLGLLAPSPAHSDSDHTGSEAPRG